MNRVRQILKSKQGMTLVEEIMASVLTLILLTAITALLSSCIRIYGDVKNTAYAQEVGEIVLDKVAGELSGAQVGIAGQTVTFENEESISAATFLDRTGSKVAAGIGGNGLLRIHYYPVDGSENGGPSFDAVDWAFDPKMYMGYTIQSLRFAKQSDTNVMSVTLVLERGSYTYTAYRYVECYNLSPDEIPEGTLTIE